MNEEFLNHLITNCHVSPQIEAKKDKINQELKAHPDYIQGMEFEVAYFTPDRKSNNLHVFIDEEWNPETKSKANRVYAEVFKANGIIINS
ncbi:hypothetical protein [Cellvibrio fibrivorans]|uniref:Uncharacterized protein n=1 Tax=Cellvibrio fibrivorans TaxID=126350 RepID=A0ABU1UYM4_9GAMM|nr:hypothetical protein [Cellvibrio fibrivorans]MDR7090288.1 hypothetical protein [Cellvibrio fibrivorans]